MTAPVLEPSLADNRTSSDRDEPPKVLILGVLIFFVSLVLSNLGGAALFEPDEGRNAEVAREEVLLLRDWVTPHYDFVPRLDKPILYFDLVALSYKIFGVSEGSARLPSSLAALACLFLTYGLARSLFGGWAALWSALVLLTGVEFFALSRIVILDMTLALFITAALCCFYFGQRNAENGKGKKQFLLMYVAMGAATLTKGPIGFLLPSAIIVFYLLLTKRKMSLRRMELPVGVLLFVLTAIPWYLLAEVRNPGYLRYFLWDENLTRFATHQFKRSGPWYYFIGVLAVGFFPWTLVLPAVFVDSWKRYSEKHRLFLILWIALPLLCFSLSLSKLPHYILPIYPPLAVIVGAGIANAYKNSAKASWVLAFPIAAFGLISLAATVLLLWPDLPWLRVPSYVNEALSRISTKLIAGNLITVAIAGMVIGKRLWTNQVCLSSATAISFVFITLLAAPITTAISLNRSSVLLAHKASSFIGPDDRLVLYDAYPSGLPFYLNIRKPIAVVWSGSKSTLLGSHYVALKRPESAPGYGEILYSYGQFADLWRTSPRRLLVFLDRKGVDEFKLLTGVTPKILLKVRDMNLIESMSDIDD